MRIYTAHGDITTYTGGEIIQIASAADKVILLLELEVGQNTVEDGTDDAAVITLERRSVARTGGTTINALPLDPGDQADSATLLEVTTTGSPTDTIEDRWDWSTLRPLTKIWTPGREFVLGGQDVAVFKMPAASVASLTLQYRLMFAEIG